LWFASPSREMVPHFGKGLTEQKRLEPVPSGKWLELGVAHSPGT
jgi:hypothetical protein